VGNIQEQIHMVIYIVPNGEDQEVILRILCYVIESFTETDTQKHRVHLCFSLGFDCILASTSRIRSCNRPFEATIPTFFSRRGPLLKSSRSPFRSVSFPPASSTTSAPAAWSQMFST